MITKLADVSPECRTLENYRAFDTLQLPGTFIKVRESRYCDKKTLAAF